MTTEEWETCVDPDPMIYALVKSGASRETFRLVCHACCKQVEHLLPSQPFRDAIPIVHALAIGRITDAERADAWGKLDPLVAALPGRDDQLRNATQAAEYLAALTICFSLWSDSRKNHGEQEGVEYALGRAADALVWRARADLRSDADMCHQLHDKIRFTQAEMLRAMFSAPRPELAAADGGIV
jgi:hypothetical protein